MTPHVSHHPVADSLYELLANTYVLYLKTQNFHWNITGQHFYFYHKMFEEQYQTLAQAVDRIAERIRNLKVLVKASFTAFLNVASLTESDHTTHSKAMIKELLADHEWISKNIEDSFEVAKKEQDEVTLDLLIDRKTHHDTVAWMLRSMVTEQGI